jgi:hypothetical protein
LNRLTGDPDGETGNPDGRDFAGVNPLVNGAAAHLEEPGHFVWPQKGFLGDGHFADYTRFFPWWEVLTRLLRSNDYLTFELFDF